jgi:hypothetical protein
MKNKLRIITGFIIWAIVSSCSADYDHYIPAPIQIRGTVTDTEGNPVNHIKITFDCGEREASLTVYTSLKGEFIADLATEATIIKINLEDIDAEVVIIDGQAEDIDPSIFEGVQFCQPDPLESYPCFETYYETALTY